jgi:exonuclease III
MKLVAWNCRGLGNRPAIRGLLDLQKSEGADNLFLSETKLDKRRMEFFRWRLGLPNMLVQKGEGKGGNCCVLVERNQCIIAGIVAILYRRGCEGG